MSLFSSLAAEMCTPTSASWMMATFSPVRIWIFANLWVSINSDSTVPNVAHSIHCSATNVLQNKHAHLKVYTACDIISSHAHQQDSCNKPLNWGTQCDMRNWFLHHYFIRPNTTCSSPSPATYLPSFYLLEAKKVGWETGNEMKPTTICVIYMLCSRMFSYKSALWTRHLGNAQQKAVTWPGPR